VQDVKTMNSTLVLTYAGHVL